MCLDFRSFLDVTEKTSEVLLIRQQILPLLGIDDNKQSKA